MPTPFSHRQTLGQTGLRRWLQQRSRRKSRRWLSSRWLKRLATARKNSPLSLAEANMGLSRGNPTATARLRPGEVVVDLGCGAGLMCCSLPKKVGPDGKAIGIDMSQEMVQPSQTQFRQSRLMERPMTARSRRCGSALSVALHRWAIARDGDKNAVDVRAVGVDDLQSQAGPRRTIPGNGDATELGLEQPTDSADLSRNRGP